MKLFFQLYYNEESGGLFFSYSAIRPPMGKRRLCQLEKRLGAWSLLQFMDAGMCVCDCVSLKHPSTVFTFVCVRVLEGNLCMKQENINGF